MNFLLNDKEILEKYNEIWDEIKNLFGKKFDSEPVYKIHKSIKAQINLYNASFYCNKKSIVSEHYTCFSAILSIW